MMVWCDWIEIPKWARRVRAVVSFDNGGSGGVSLEFSDRPASPKSVSSARTREEAENDA